MNWDKTGEYMAEENGTLVGVKIKEQSDSINFRPKDDEITLEEAWRNKVLDLLEEISNKLSHIESAISNTDAC